MNTPTTRSEVRPVTAPPIVRSPMQPRPWFGLLRGSLMAVLPGVQFFWNLVNTPPWMFAAQRRRRALLLAVALFATAAAARVTAGAPADAGVVWVL